MTDITMQDIRLVCGEGKLENRHVLNAVNIIIKRREEQRAPQPVSAAQASRDRIYEIVLRELETKHPIPTTVLLATRIANAIAAAPQPLDVAYTGAKPWRTDMENAPKDRPFLAYWHMSDIYGVLEWIDNKWIDQDGDEVVAFRQWSLFDLPERKASAIPSTHRETPK